MQLAPDQLATVLAALRYYQQQGLGDPTLRPLAIHDIASNYDQIVSLDAQGIDELCEALNTAATPPAFEADAFIRTIAGMRLDDEYYDSDGCRLEDEAAAEAAGIQPFEMSIDDAFSNLHVIISDARRIAAMVPSLCDDLHSPDLAFLIPAIVAAYESVRQEAAQAHQQSGVPIAVCYDRISNGEEATPFSYCPVPSVPLIQRFGKILVTLGA